MMMMMKFAANLRRGFHRPTSSLLNNWKFQAAKAISATTKSNTMISSSSSSSPRYKVYYFNCNRFGYANLRLQQQQRIYYLRRLFYEASSSSSGSFRRLHNSKFSSSNHYHHEGRGRRRRSNKNRERTAAIERNKKIISLGKQQKWKEILDFYKTESRRLNNVNYATIMKQLEKIPSFNATTTTTSRNPIFHEFMDELATKIETLGLDWIGIREIANIVNAIGKMGFKKKPTNNNNNNIDNIDGPDRIIQFAAKTKNAHYIASKGKPQHISMICWGMSKFGDMKSLHNMFSNVEPQLARRLLLAKDDEELDPQVLSNLAYICAESGLRSRTLFAFIEEHATWLVENWTPQGISNSAWACATLGIQSPNLFAAIERRPVWLVNNGMSQNISNTAWASATLGNQSPNLFAEIEKNSTRLVENGESRAISNTAWSCATLGIHCPNLFAAIEKNSTWLVENGKPQDIANTAWAGATLGIHCPNLFAAIEKNSTWLVENGIPQEISNTAWSFVKLRYASPNLLAAIEEDAARLVKNGSSQAVANVALAFAMQGVPSSKYFGSIMENLDKLLNEANEQGIINVCYSIAALDLARESIEGFLMLWSKALRLNPKNISDEGWVQLAETYLFVASTGLKIQKPPKIPSEITFPDHPESRSHRDVSRTLKEIGFQHQEEVSPLLVNNDEHGESPLLSSTPFLPPRMLAIDFACPERKIAIEFDGPYHFLIEVPSGKVSNVENGPTKAKRLFLQRLGWKVYNVRYDDWYHKGKNAQQGLLRSLLES